MRRRDLLVAAVFPIGTVLASIIPAAAENHDQRGGWRRLTGPGGMAPLRQDLSVDDVRHMMEHHLAWEYHGRLKLGKVGVRDADTIIADLVTPDGYLVQRLEVNRHTGWVRPAK